MMRLNASLRPAPAQSIPKERTPAERSVRFLHEHYDTQAGYVEIIAGQSDPTRPDKITLDITTRRWLYVHPERPDLYETIAAYGQQLAHTHGNVYVGVRLYTKQAKIENTRKEAYTLPSTRIFVDDAPANPSLPYSYEVQTSEHSRHGYYKCDKPTTKDDSRRVAAALGGDPSGVDLTQLVRLVGTFNTKRGERWPVTGRTVNRVYALADLREHFPAPVKAQRSHTTPSSSTAPLPDDLFDAARITSIRARLDGRTSLLQTATSTIPYITKVPARIKPGTQTYRILTEASYRAQWKNKGGSWDASLVRYIVCKGLIHVGYDADHITAFLDYLEDPETQEIKGVVNLQGDYARLFAPDKLGPLYAHKQAEQRQYHARQDRPQQHTVDSYYTWLSSQQQDGRVLLKRRERAAGAGISTATLDRLEDALERSGRITIETTADRSGSTVVLHRGVINILVTETAGAPANDAPTVASEVLSGQCNEDAEYGAAMSKNAHDAVTHKEHTAPLPLVCPVPVPDALSAGGEHRGACVPLSGGSGATNAAPELPPTPRPVLALLVREVFDAYPGRVITLKRFQGYLALNDAGGVWSPTALQSALAGERTRRQKVQARGFWDALNAEIAGLRDLAQSELISIDKRLARTVGTAVKLDAARQAGTAKPDAKMPRGLVRARLLMPHVVKELERREAVEAARIVAKGYSLAEQAEMLDLAATARVQAQPTPQAARVETPKTAEFADMPTPNGWSMIARLKAQRDQRIALSS